MVMSLRILLLFELITQQQYTMRLESAYAFLERSNKRHLMLSQKVF